MVGCSFMSLADIEAKNNILQGYESGRNGLVKFDTAGPSIHAYYRRSQRKPLFQKDGKDFDLNNSEESDRVMEVDGKLIHADAGDSSPWWARIEASNRARTV